MPSLSESTDSWTKCEKSKSVVMISVAKRTSTRTGDLFFQLYILTLNTRKKMGLINRIQENMFQRTRLAV